MTEIGEEVTFLQFHHRVVQYNNFVACIVCYLFILHTYILYVSTYKILFYKY